MYIPTGSYHLIIILSKLQWGSWTRLKFTRRYYHSVQTLNNCRPFFEQGSPIFRYSLHPSDKTIFSESKIKTYPCSMVNHHSWNIQSLNFYFAFLPSICIVYWIYFWDVFSFKVQCNQYNFIPIKYHLTSYLHYLYQNLIQMIFFGLFLKQIFIKVSLLLVFASPKGLRRSE